jgi:polar amino acid transport system permease protein
VPVTGSTRTQQDEGVRNGVIAGLSTLVVFVFIGLLVVRAPGWVVVKKTFLNGFHFRRSFPQIWKGFLRNVELCLIAEVFVLALGLLIAVVRMLPGPVLFPFRLLATIFTDVFRGVPSILLIYLFGFGIPALGLPRSEIPLIGLPVNSPWLWGTIAIILNSAAYEAEVFRSGMNSIHPSQMAAARSLGLSQWKALRYVIIPQAVRRVIPPLMNDFVSLQKTTALVSVLGPVEALRAAQNYASLKFNYTAYLGSALLFLLLTIPLARFTDWLILRQDRKRR